ncbi:MAG: hypothetical protein ABI402_17145 [Ferruginibacter sp.]
MNRTYFIKYFLIVISFSTQLSSHAQIATEEKLLGCWKMSKFEFLKPVKDSADLISSMKNYISCFEKNGKFTTKIKTKNGEKPVGTGIYSIGADGKTIYQKRNAEDDGVNSPGEVVFLTERELAIKIDNVILHLVKITK